MLALRATSGYERFHRRSNMNVDQILRALNDEQVDYLLIGGMNFLLRHRPELTFDVDIWVRDKAENLERLNRALQKLEAAWGPTEQEWHSVANDWRWLQRQGCFCLTTAHGALDIFRDVRGLEGCYDECKAAAVPSETGSAVLYRGLADEHMLACQEALPPEQQKQERMRVLREAIHNRNGKK